MCRGKRLPISNGSPTGINARSSGRSPVYAKPDLLSYTVQIWRKANMTDTTELVARLRDQQDMIQLGEDAYEAADAIERLTRERDEARAAALEEAAGVADATAIEYDTGFDERDERANWIALNIAADIRALDDPT